MIKKEITIFGWSLLAACFTTIPFLGILFNVAMLIYALIEYHENKNKSKYIKAVIIMSLIAIVINILVTISMIGLYNYYSGRMPNSTPEMVFRAMQYNMR